MDEFEYDEELLAEGGSLDEETRRRVLYVHAHLEQVDHYQLLGVSREAGRKDIRKAYFKLSKKYHPDLFYGKDTGSYGQLVEDIFHQLNKAHQTLSHKKKRAEYDAQLGQQAPPAASPASSSVGRASSAPSAASPSPSGEHKQVDERKREMAFNLLVKRGEKHEAAGDYEAAAAEYKKAFSVKHAAPVALRGANLLMRCGEEFLEEAILLAKAAAREEPDNCKPLILIGDAYEERGDYDQARLYYEQARELDEDNKIVGRRLKYLDSLTS